MQHMTAAETADVEAAVRDLFERTNAAWGDADAYASWFTEDADYVAFDGSRTEGRAAIAEMHRPLFAGFMKGSRLSAQITALRLLAPDVALIHTSGGVLRGQQRRPAHSSLSVQTYVAVKRDGAWRFTAFQNTRYRPFDRTLLGRVIALFAKQQTR